MPGLAKKASINSVELNDFMLPAGRWSRVWNWMAYIWGYRATSKKMRKYTRRTINKLNAELEKYNIQCTSWTIDSDLTVDDVAWRDELAYIITGFKTAEILGAKYLRITLGGAACMGPEIDPIVSSRLKFIAALRKNLFPDIEPVVENHWGLSTEPDRFLSIMAEAPEIGICFDPGNTPKINQEANWEKLAAKTKLFHLKIYDLDLEKIDKDLNYPMIFQLLAKENYSGKFVIEYEGDENPDMILSKFLNGISNWRDSGFRRIRVPARNPNVSGGIRPNDGMPLVPPSLASFTETNSN